MGLPRKMMKQFDRTAWVRRLMGTARVQLDCTACVSRLIGTARVCRLGGRVLIAALLLAFMLGPSSVWPGRPVKWTPMVEEGSTNRPRHALLVDDLKQIAIGMPMWCCHMLPLPRPRVLVSKVRLLSWYGITANGPVV